jgi:hypothetical protein
MTKRIILGAIAILLVIASAYAAFFIAPEERTMGVIQRIFIFTLPAPGPDSPRFSSASSAICFTSGSAIKITIG